MDLYYLKQTLDKIELLGLNTQPIRDLYAKVQTGLVDPLHYTSIIKTINSTIDKSNLQPNSQPVQIQMLVDQIEKKLKKPANIQRTPVSNISRKDKDPLTDINDQLLGLLSQLTKDVKDLKNVNTNTNTNTNTLQQVPTLNQIPVEVGPNKQKQITTPSVLDTAFISPIDTRDSNIKSTNVDIKSEAGDNISNKLKKLKKLKNSND